MSNTYTRDRSVVTKMVYDNMVLPLRTWYYLRLGKISENLRTAEQDITHYPVDLCGVTGLQYVLKNSTRSTVIFSPGGEQAIHYCHSKGNQLFHFSRIIRIKA